jgi:hypothetical protein
MRNSDACTPTQMPTKRLADHAWTQQNLVFFYFVMSKCLLPL